MSSSLPVITPIGRKLLRLHLTPELGPIRLKNLLKAMGSADAILGASVKQLEQVRGIGPVTARSIAQGRDQVALEHEIEQAERNGARIACWADPDYPAILKRISDPPICLYVRGRIEPEDAVALAIVGARRCSHYGMEQTRRFAEGLARAGFTIVSGLARGIDGIAHQAALDVGGRTLAVLGHGLNQLHPPEHHRMAQGVSQAGALMSELAMDLPPDDKNFPRRNRIIAGLALGVLVVEAGRRSGALITARLAGESNREVFAVPGRVDQPEFSAGTNGLIRDGAAQLVTSVEDVLEGLADVGRIMNRELRDDAPTPSACASPPPSIDSTPTLFEGSSPDSSSLDPDDDLAALPRAPGLSADEDRVLRVLSSEGLDVETIHRTSNLEVGKVVSILTSLQLKGAVKRLPGDRYVRKNSHFL